MSKVELIMPKMGESIMEATILKWLKEEGDTIEAEESVLEIATDKVDSEVPSPVDGVLAKILFKEGETVAVGKAIAIIEVEQTRELPINDLEELKTLESPAKTVVNQPATFQSTEAAQPANNGFFSPLVLNMAREEGIAMGTLATVRGTGKNGRVTKKDMVAFIKNKDKAVASTPVTTPKETTKPTPKPTEKKSTSASNKDKSITITPPKVTYGDNVEIIEMDRMRKLIADHMVMSKHVSPHVTSFVEVDMTPIVQWRNKIKNDFQQREGQKITFTPIFVEAVTKAIKDFPMINSSVDGTNIIIRKDINIGMATATPSGNLIVPVIKNADYKNLIGLAKTVNDLAERARTSKLKPDEIQGGTFTMSNIGSFGSLMGTPIINQPQVAILAIGMIRKMPAVVETEYGDVIAIRQKMIMSLSYDHRIVDGALGSKFLKRVADYLEAFDTKRSI